MCMSAASHWPKRRLVIKKSMLKYGAVEFKLSRQAITRVNYIENAVCICKTAAIFSWPECTRGCGYDFGLAINHGNGLILESCQGLYSLSGKTSYRKISWSLEAARFGLKLFQLLWNLAGTSAALLPRCLSNFNAIRPLQHPISRLRDFTRFGGKTSYREWFLWTISYVKVFAVCPRIRHTFCRNTSNVSMLSCSYVKKSHVYTYLYNLIWRLFIS